MGSIFLHCAWYSNGPEKMCDIESDLNVEIHVDSMPEDQVPAGVFRIIAILEPFDHLKRLMLNYLDKNKECYNYIFTYHKDILSKYKNSMLSVTPTTWTRDYISDDKSFSVSGVFGNKHDSPHLPKLDGYLQRWELWTRRNEILMQKRFFLSSTSPIPNEDYENGLVLKDSKAPLFSSQFHIAIENTRRIDNAFSEKLIDCFQTKTVPIYYGPRNIGDFFNPAGIIPVKNVGDIIEVCNNLTADDYKSRLLAIEDNYQRSMNYSSFTDSMIRQSKQVINININ